MELINDLHISAARSRSTPNYCNFERYCVLYGPVKDEVLEGGNIAGIAEKNKLIRNTIDTGGRPNLDRIAMEEGPQGREIAEYMTKKRSELFNSSLGQNQTPNEQQSGLEKIIKDLTEKIQSEHGIYGPYGIHLCRQKIPDLFQLDQFTEWLPSMFRY